MAETSSTNLILDFKRDFVLGDTGEDVAVLHKMLAFIGFEAGEEDVKNKRFGESTLEAANKMREWMVDHPVIAFFAQIIMQFVFGSEVEEADPANRRGDHVPIREYRNGSLAQLQALEHSQFGKRGATAAAQLAASYVGQRELGDTNKGDVVRYFNGESGEGLPWCGGFVHKIMSVAISPNLYSQTDFLRARSFEDEAARHGAFRKTGQGYQPRVGDVVVFSRGQGQGHCGIVISVEKDGKVTYVAGNDANAVRATSFNLNQPPASFIGYSDTHALAAAKGIAMDAPSFAIANPRTSIGNVRAHSDSAIRGG